MTGHVFISYSHANKVYAECVLAALESQGVQCWIAPRNVPPGGSYAAALLTAIESSSCFVLVYTAQANMSAHVLREVERALTFGINIVPIRFDDSQVSKSLDYLLATVHWLSALSEPREQAIAHAAHQIASFTTQAGSPPAAKPQPVVAPPKSSPPSVRRPSGSRTVLIAALAVLALLAVSALFLLHPKAEDSTASAENLKSPGPAATAGRPSAGKNRVRVALVIGNGRYGGSIGALPNAVPDARAVAQALDGKGFSVMLLTDASRSELVSGIEQFRTLLSLGGVGMVYYSGHGCQIAGDNYLIPISGLPSSAPPSPGSATRGIKILEKNEAVQAQNAVIDPSSLTTEATLKASAVNITQLLAPVSKLMTNTPEPSGDVIMYATTAGDIALDGPAGQHSPFCEAILQALAGTNGDLLAVFQTVGAKTRELSDGRQTPWMNTSFLGRFDFANSATDADLGILRVFLIDTCRNNVFETR